MLGCVAALLATMAVMLIIGAAGGTGTQDGSILGTFWGTCTSMLTFFLVVLVLAWLLTEPSFKKVEEEPEIDTRNQYVKKAAHPHPMANKTADAPAAEAKADAPAAEIKTEDAPASK